MAESTIEFIPIDPQDHRREAHGALTRAEWIHLHNALGLDLLSGGDAVEATGPQGGRRALLAKVRAIIERSGPPTA